MAARKQPKVPLAWRVPNAPFAFVGRRAELRSVKAAIRRGPLVVLVGPGGIGKTSLACAAVKELFARRRSEAVMVGARPGIPFQQTLVELVRALGHDVGRQGADLATLAVDLVEARNAIVVIDDLHHAPGEAEALLSGVARYARRGVWIATSRVVPHGEELDDLLKGQVIHVAPIAERELVRLARLVDASLTRRQAVRVAKKAVGSPWKARQLLSKRGGADDSTTRSLLTALSAAQRPISAEALSEFVGRGVTGRARALVRRGLVETVGGGYRLHDVARSRVRAPRDDGASLVTALAGSQRDEDALEALRLALDRGDEPRALAICASSFDAMLRSGHAVTLWSLLAPEHAPAWGSFKLRTAMQLADIKVTSVLEEPPREALPDRLLWVRALSIEVRGGTRALDAADALDRDARASGDPRIAFWAALQHAMSRRVVSGPERGLELAERVEPVDDATRALLVAHRAFWLAESGRIEEATELLDRTVPRGPLETPMSQEILGGPIDFFVRYYRMAALHDIGHLERAYEALTEGRDSFDVDDQLRASYVQLGGIAHMAIARGRLDEAGTILARLLRSPGGTTYHTVSRLFDIDLRIARGSFETVRRDLALLLDETRMSNPLVHAWCTHTGQRLDQLDARSVEPLDVDTSTLGAVGRSVHVLRCALREARWGKVSAVPEAVDVEGAILREFVLAAGAMSGGRKASEHARRAVSAAVLDGWAIYECEARAMLADALVLEGDVHGALVEARALASRAATMTSPRFEGEARLVIALVEPPAPDAATLDELAASGNVSPCASRRARAMLGDGSAPLDAVDVRILEKARELAPATLVRLGPSHGRGWGIDVRRRAAWLPDGRRIALSRHLARVLDVLGRHGGQASFEVLAQEVWERRAFHPLHDHNRIRVALHRLRSLVEESPSRPKRLLVDGSSYRIGDEPFTVVNCNPL